MQAKIGDQFYATTEARAALNEDGTVTIQGLNQFESMTLQIASLEQGNFTIEEGSRNYAVYNDPGGNVYTTIPNGTGSITISELDETNKTLSGIFKFDAFLSNIDTIYVSKGVLYNISYIGGDIADPNNAGIFNAKVNGNLFMPITVSSRNTGNAILTSASSADATLVISVPANVVVGVYSLPRAGFAARYQGTDGPESTTGGLIEILEHNITAKTIKGTFSFVTETTEITEGLFDVTYQ